MGQKVTVTVGDFSAKWETGTPYIDIHMYGSEYPVHTLNTSGDLGGDGWPKDGRTAYQYVRDELKTFVDEDGGDYREAYAPHPEPVQELTERDMDAIREVFGPKNDPGDSDD